MNITISENQSFECFLEAFVDQLQQGAMIPTLQACRERYPKFADEIDAHFPGVFIAEKLRRRSLAAHIDLQFPVLIGNFSLTGKLGRGGMASVFKANCQHSKDEVAVKLIDCAKANQKEIDRFQQESRTIAAVTHSGIPEFIDAGQHENYMYIAMRKVEGINFQQLFSEPMVISNLDDEPHSISGNWKLMAIIFREVAHILAYIHHRGLVHRDIKPSNLMIDDESKVWITDLGLASNLRHCSAPLALDEMAGTHAYLAPECYESKVGFQSDIYSLGVSIYELATGVAATILSKPHGQKSRQKLPRVRNVNNEIPKPLAAIIDRCCEFDLAKRYPDSETVASALQDFVMSKGEERGFMKRLIQPAAKAIRRPKFLIAKSEKSKDS